MGFYLLHRITVFLLLWVVITRCLMSAPNVSHPLKLTQLFDLNQNWVAALSLSTQLNDSRFV